MVAIRQNSVEVFQLLLEFGATITAEQCNETAALHKVAQHGSVDLLKTLLSIGADVNHLNSDGQLALHRACQSGDSDMVQVLLDQGSSADVQDKDGLTPLHVAAKYNAVNCCELLMHVLKTPDSIVHVLDSKKRSVLGCSFYYSSEDVICLFIRTLKKRQIRLSDLKDAITCGVNCELLNKLNQLCDESDLSLHNLADIYK